MEDRPINNDEDEILQIVKKYSGGNPYAAITYDQIDPEDWKAFSSDTVETIVREYLAQDHVDHVRLRWFFRRLAQVGHPGALQVIVDNLTNLEPCLPSICFYVSAIQAVPPDEWKAIGTLLIRHLESGEMFDDEFARLSLLSLFSRNEYIDHFPEIVRRFNAGDLNTRREVLLAALVNSMVDWLREQKESYPSMDRWQQMAYLYCTSILPDEERKFFLKDLQGLNHFEENLRKWARNPPA